MTRNLVSVVRDLQRRKARKRRRMGVAEGVRLVEEALSARVRIEGVVAAPSLSDTPRGAALLQEIADHAIPIESVTERQLAELADTETPQGVLAVVEPPRWSLDGIRPESKSPVLVLDAVQDPGNVGALVRTAFGLGLPGAVLLKGTADTANPKVMRAAMGATFRLPTAYASEAELEEWSRREGVEVWAAWEEGTPLSRLDPPERLALVVGNEGAGLSSFVRSLARHTVAVPLARGADSLNVAVAAGIILYSVIHRA
ncbi:MAG: TrmH family RNA methyltransferase [Gemmatimonadales bacterium]